MQEVILQSGKKLEIQQPRFGAVMDLIRCACREIKKDGLSIDLEAMKTGDILGVILSLVGSKEFEESFWLVSAGCLYNGERVTQSLFEDRPEAREDYFEIQYKIIEASLKPFGKSLLTMLQQNQVVK